MVAKSLKLVGGLVTGWDGKSLSIGRTLLVSTFSVIMLHWLAPFILNRTVPVPDSLNGVFQSLLLYEVFKHGKHAAERIMSTKKGETNAD